MKVADRSADLMVRTGAEFGLTSLSRQRIAAGTGGFAQASVPASDKFLGLIGGIDRERPGGNPA
jgi:hypothetical protein